MLRKLSVLVLVVWGIKLGLKSAMIDHAKSIERRDLFLGTMPSTYYSMVGVCGCKERTHLFLVHRVIIYVLVTDDPAAMPPNRL